MKVQRRQLAHFGRSLAPARPSEAAFRARRSKMTEQRKHDTRAVQHETRGRREGPLSLGRPIGQISMTFAITMRASSLASRPLTCHLAHARDLIAAWVTDYNTARPHSALGYQTPAGFSLHLTTAIARPAARDESSARRAIALPAPIGVNDHRTPVVAGRKTSGRSP